MPKTTKTVATLAALALAACGGNANDTGPGGSIPASDAVVAAAAPTYDQVSLQIDEGDATPALRDDVSQSQDLAAPSCHPHLFTRTSDVVHFFNAFLWKILHHERELIAKSSTLTAGSSKTWTDVSGGIARQFVMSLAADGVTYSFTLGLGAAAATPAYTTVMTGTIATSTSGTVTESKGAVTFDFSAYKSVVTTEKATGSVAATFDYVKDTSRPAGQQLKRSVSYALTNFQPNDGNPHGPQNATYVHLHEPGVGGYFSYTDSLVLLCPNNPNNQAADLQTFARWTLNNGAVDGRSDTQATGGQIPAGDKFEGVTCYAGVKGEATNQSREASGYWMMKLENAAGATVSGSATESSSGASPCDPAFGAVPALTSNATDFDFSKLPAAPIFPGQW